MVPVEFTVVFLGLTLFGLGLLHVYWSAGGNRYREFATPRVDGRPTASPSAFAHMTVAAGLWAAGLLAASRVTAFGGWRFHGAATTWLWIFAALFAFRAIGDCRLVGFFCRYADATHRNFERKFTAPLCVLLSIGFVRLALYRGLT